MRQEMWTAWTLDVGLGTFKRQLKREENEKSGLKDLYGYSKDFCQNGGQGLHSNIINSANRQ